MCIIVATGGHRFLEKISGSKGLITFTMYFLMVGFATIGIFGKTQYPNTFTPQWVNVCMVSSGLCCVLGLATACLVTSKNVVDLQPRDIAPPLSAASVAAGGGGGVGGGPGGVAPSTRAGTTRQPSLPPSLPAGALLSSPAFEQQRQQQLSPVLTVSVLDTDSATFLPLLGYPVDRDFNLQLLLPNGRNGGAEQILGVHLPQTKMSVQANGEAAHSARGPNAAAGNCLTGCNFSTLAGGQYAQRIVPPATTAATAAAPTAAAVAAATAAAESDVKCVRNLFNAGNETTGGGQRDKGELRSPQDVIFNNNNNNSIGGCRGGGDGGACSGLDPETPPPAYGSLDMSAASAVAANGDGASIRHQQSYQCCEAAGTFHCTAAGAAAHAVGGAVAPPGGAAAPAYRESDSSPVVGHHHHRLAPLPPPPPSLPLLPPASAGAALQTADQLRSLVESQFSLLAADRSPPSPPPPYDSALLGKAALLGKRVAVAGRDRSGGGEAVAVIRRDNWGSDASDNGGGGGSGGGGGCTDKSGGNGSGENHKRAMLDCVPPLPPPQPPVAVNSLPAPPTELLFGQQQRVTIGGAHQVT